MRFFQTDASKQIYNNFCKYTSFLTKRFEQNLFVKTLWNVWFIENYFVYLYWCFKMRFFQTNASIQRYNNFLDKQYPKPIFLKSFSHQSTNTKIQQLFE